MAVLGALGDLVLALSADTAKFQSDLGRAQRVADKFGREVGRALGNVAGALVALGGSAGFVALVKGQIDAADAAGKLGQKVGIATEQLSAYMVAARLSDVSNQQLQTGLQQLAKNQADFVVGMGEAASAFEALGISQEQVKALNGDTAKIFDLVAGKLAQFEDGANKTALAMKIFGKSGAELIPMINGLEQAREEAALLGAVIDKDTAAAAERFNDNLTRAGISVQAFGLTIAKSVLPTLEQMSEQLTLTARDTEGMAKAGAIADTGLKLLATAGAIVVSVFQTAGQAVGAMAAMMVQLLQGEFVNAARTAQYRFVEFGTTIGETVAKVEMLWTESGTKVQASAPTTGKRLAAPALAMAKEVKKAADDSEKVLAALYRARHDEAMQVATFEEGLRKGEEADRDKMNRQVLENIDAEIEAREEQMRVEAGFGEQVKKTEQKASSFGFTFNSALEDAILNGAKLSDVMKALEQDIARMILRKAVTEPLGNAIAGAVGGIDFGGLFGGGEAAALAAGIQPLATGTDFVPADGLKYLHRGEAVIPAGENGARGVTIVQNIKIDSRSDRASIMQAMGVARDQAVAEVKRQQDSRGSARI